MPRARYAGGCAFVVSDVGGSMMGKDLVATFLGVHGIGGIKGFYWDDDGGFVYINEKMWPLLWTRVVVNMDKKLTIYYACDVYPADIEESLADLGTQTEPEIATQCDMAEQGKKNKKGRGTVKGKAKEVVDQNVGSMDTEVDMNAVEEIWQEFEIGRASWRERVSFIV